MSDGPFMSPTTKRCWQPVAERAALDSFTMAELREAVVPALAAEGRELPTKFREEARKLLCAPREGQLWTARESGEIEALHRSADGYELALSMVDWIEDALVAGRSGDQALIEAASAALSQCWTETSRSLEEHAQRQALDQAIAPRVRERLKGAAPTSEQIGHIARDLFKLDAEALARSAPKHTEIEDGPALLGTADDQ